MSSGEEVKIKHVFTWRVENFSRCSKKKGEKLNSPTFKAKSFDETAWYLELYPQGDEKSDDGFISCYLRRKEDDAFPFAIECVYIIEIINEIGLSVKLNKSSTRKFENGERWGWRNFMKQDDLRRSALFDDTLVFRCTLCKIVPVHSQDTRTTKFQSENYYFQWAVQNLNSITPQEVIKFSCSGSSLIEITIQIPEDYVKMCIKMNNNNSGSTFILCNLILLDIEKKERASRQATNLFQNTREWEFPTFIKKSQLNAERDIYLKDDCFTLQCNITVSDDSVVENIEEKVYLSADDKLAVPAVDTFAILKEDIRRLHTDNILADVKLQVGEQIFSAHKCILSARSPVFLDMFDSDMVERQKGEVDIPDLDSKTVGLFLEYIYTGTVSDLDCENAIKLIVVADKYQVVSLVDKCAELLASILCDSNVCKILVTADLVQHDILKTSAVSYIKMKPEKIFKSEDWKHCVKSNVSLAIETASEVAILLGGQAKEQSCK